MDSLSDYCFLNHSHDLITLKFVILACMCICRHVARRRASWLSYSCLARIIYLVLRVNLPGLTHPDLAGLP